MVRLAGAERANNATNAAANCGEGSTQVPLGGLPGDNNAKNTTCQACELTYPGGDYNAYGRLSEGRLGTTNKGIANNILDDRMLDMCETMKAQGIIIYTMTFGPSPDAGTTAAVSRLRYRAGHVLARGDGQPPCSRTS